MQLKLANAARQHVNGRSFIDPALLERAIDGEVKMLVDPLVIVAVQHVEWANTVERRFGQPHKRLCRAHEAHDPIGNKDVLCPAMKQNIVEHVQVRGAQVACGQFVSPDRWNMQQFDERDMVRLLNREPDTGKVAVVAPSVT